ncbi:MAG: formylmethanofuran dehydrogenase [Nitrospirales bacterium]|nr:formylmethanofuran dehydrogenase [Nitrospirales bacterium]
MKGGLRVEERTEEFRRLLDEAAAFHGHLCAGQVIGVRMAMAGLEAIGIRDPRGEDRKKLIVFVEIDRCATDAIMTVTGCRPGKRSMKLRDYGKMAATFVNLETGRAVRVTSQESSRRKAASWFPEIADESKAQLEAYKVMPDSELFEFHDVVVNLRPEDLPGKPLRRVVCQVCGEPVMDMREVVDSGRVLCRPCSEGRNYYTFPTLL